MRVVALRAEPSLAAALNMTTDWEVVYADDPEQAAQVIAGANVVLIGGGTEEGLRLAESVRTLGITIPAVVVGDTPASESARHPVLTPPFTLDELHAAVARAVAGAEQSVPVLATEADELKREPRPSSTAGDESSRSGLKVVREEASAPAAAPRVAAAAHEALAPPVPSAPSAAPAASTRLKPSPPPPIAPKEQPPAGERHRPPKSSGEHGGRGILRRRSRATVAAESPVFEHLRAAFDGLAHLEKSIDELPVLIDLQGLAQALIGEVVDLLTPETAGIYLPGPGGFRVWASHGFSNVEKNMVVQSHQPLFVDLLVRHEALLIEPLDLAQSLATGVGGARTNSFLASPIEVNRTCIGVIVAGRGHFDNEDLDRLEALATEAAAGLGVALGLDRLRTKLS